MTKREWIATAIIGVVAVGLLVYFWPHPGTVDRGLCDQDVFARASRRSSSRETPPPARNRADYRPSLQEMEEAARKLAKQFEPVRDEVMKAVREGDLEEAQPYPGEVPVPGEVVVLRLVLLSDGKPTCDWKKGRTSVSIGGLDSLDLDNPGKTGPDYELLASVLSAMRIRKQADSQEGLTVELQPMAFVPLESVKKVVEAAGRARAARIQFKQSPLPY